MEYTRYTHTCVAAMRPLGRPYYYYYYYLGAGRRDGRHLGTPSGSSNEFPGQGPPSRRLVYRARIRKEKYPRRGKGSEKGSHRTSASVAQEDGDGGRTTKEYPSSFNLDNCVKHDGVWQAFVCENVDRWPLWGAGREKGRGRNRKN